MSTLFNSIWPIDKTLVRSNILRQSGPGTDDNEGALYILCSGILQPHDQIV